MSKQSNFYKDLAGLGVEQEKIASHRPSIADSLASFNVDEIEAIANEMGCEYQKIASEGEDVIGNQTKKEELDDKKDANSQDNASTSNPAESSGNISDAVGNEGSEQAKAEGHREEVTNENAKANEEVVSKSAAIDIAYDMVEEKLASVGYSLADYMFSKVANEEQAIFLADNVEKLASITGLSPYRVADDLIGAIEEKIGY